MKRKGETDHDGPPDKKRKREEVEEEDDDMLLEVKKRLKHEFNEKIGL